MTLKLLRFALPLGLVLSSLALAAQTENAAATVQGTGQNAPQAAPSAPSQALDSNFQKVRALDDPIVGDVETVLAEAGTTFLSYSGPYSDDELRSNLDRVDPEKLSAEGRAAYSRARDALKPNPNIRDGAFGAKVGFEANLDVNYRGNESVPWINGYQQRPSFLSVPVDAWGNTFMYGYFDPAFQRDYYSVNMPVSQLKGGANWTSVPIDLECTDMNFPFRTFAAVGGDNWNFRIGRDRLSIGSMGEDNILVNSQTEWYDYARLSVFFRDFQYSMYSLQLNTNRYLYMHHVDLLLFDKLNVGLTEGCLVGQAAFELRYLNPLMVFHGYLSWVDETVSSPTSGGQTTTDTTGAGSEMGIELNYALGYGITIVGQYQFNAGQDPFGLKKLFWPQEMSELPTDAAYLLGLKYVLPLSGGHLKASLCGVYSTPYDQILGNDQISYIYSRASNSNYSNANIEEWIGFADGPDCILVDSRVSYELPSRASGTLLASYRWKGVNDLNTVYAKTTDTANAVTPTGVVEGRLRLGVELSLPIYSFCTLTLGTYYTHRDNASNSQGASDQSFEELAGVKISL